MGDESRRLTVSIGQYAYLSRDGGTSWVRSLREVPGRHTPIIRGDLDHSHLPPKPEGVLWDFITVLPCGFGVAVDHHTGDDRPPASLFVTEEGRRAWRQMELRVNSLGWHSTRPASWPVGRFASLALPTPGCIALAWDDPWLFDAPQSHVLCSPDGGVSWEYRCLGQSSPYLAHDYSGRLLALNDGYYLESPDGGRTWARRDSVVKWPAGYHHKKVALLRQVTFPAPNMGYALIVHWRHRSMNEPAPDVGLLTTCDNGNSWRHVHLFEGPNAGDVNERHVLGLRVE